MKAFLGLIRQATPARVGGDSLADTFFFSTAFSDQGIDASSLLPWAARANAVGAKRQAAENGRKLPGELLSRRRSTMMRRADPALAARLIALLARKLSRRMRVVSARFGEKQS